jgi:hypothetical protein
VRGYFILAIFVMACADERPGVDDDPGDGWRVVHEGEEALTAAGTDLKLVASQPVTVNKSIAQARAECPGAVLKNGGQHFLYATNALPGAAFGTGSLPACGAYLLKIAPTTAGAASSTSGYRADVFVKVPGRVDWGMRAWVHPNDEGTPVRSEGFVVSADLTLPDPPLPSYVGRVADAVDPCGR